MRQQSKKLTLFLGLSLALFALVLGIFFSTQVFNTKKIDSSHFNGTLLDKPREVISFALTGIDDKPFTEKSLTKHWTMMFFGFTRCGSMCPTTMAELAKMYRLLKDRGVSPLPRVVMVSIDTEHDTAARLNTYVHAFDPSFYGAVGEVKEIEQLTHDFGIAYAKISRKLKGGHVVHDIEHTGAILLFNPKGQLMAFFTTPHHAAGLADDYQWLMG